MSREGPYDEHPRLTRGCTYCGSSAHKLFDDHGRLTCSQKKTAPPGLTSCDYPSCQDRDTHLTAMCPTLHRRCTHCHHRGHGPKDVCRTWSAKRFARARDEFEKMADEGRWTRTRRRDERWGFFCHIKGTPFPYPHDYDHYLQLDVFVAGWVLSIRDQHGTPVLSKKFAVSTKSAHPGSRSGYSSVARHRYEKHKDQEIATQIDSCMDVVKNDRSLECVDEFFFS